MASNPFSIINRRARSCLSWRSSRVIGVASFFREVNFASDGGREELSFPGAVEAARFWDAAIPPNTLPTSRKRLREIMGALFDSVNEWSLYVDSIHRVQAEAGGVFSPNSEIRFPMRRLRRVERNFH